MKTTLLRQLPKSKNVKCSKALYEFLGESSMRIAAEQSSNFEWMWRFFKIVPIAFRLCFYRELLV